MAWPHCLDKQILMFWYGGWIHNHKSVVMKTHTLTPAKTSLPFLFTLVFFLTNTTLYANTGSHKKATALAAKKAEMRMVVATAATIYTDMDLVDSGLSIEAFRAAWIGYYKLKKQGLLKKTDVLTICDFSQASSKERMYVIDVRNRKVLYRTFVAHGINSGEEFASSFSNRMESCKSSLGFYVTSGTYTGSNGLSLRINGMDKGFNDNARKRAIVIHGAGYVSRHILQKYG